MQIIHVSVPSLFKARNDIIRSVLKEKLDRRLERGLQRWDATHFAMQTFGKWSRDTMMSQGSHKQPRHNAVRLILQATKTTLSYFLQVWIQWKGSEAVYTSSSSGNFFFVSPIITLTIRTFWVRQEAVHGDVWIRINPERNRTRRSFFLEYNSRSRVYKWNSTSNSRTLWSLSSKNTRKCIVWGYMETIFKSKFNSAR